MDKKKIGKWLIQGSMVAMFFLFAAVALAAILAIVVVGIPAGILWLPTYGIYRLGLYLWGEDYYEDDSVIGPGRIYAEKKEVVVKSG